MSKFKYLFLITNVIILITFLIIFFLPDLRKTLENSSDNVLPATTQLPNTNYFNLNLSQISPNLVSNIVRIEQNDNLELINNLEKKLTSSQALSQYDCNVLTSSYFYTSENVPLGLVEISSDVIQKNNDSSTLINGYFAMSAADTALILDHPGTSTYKFIFQTGPLFLLNNNELTGTLESDSSKRRIVAATDGYNTLYLITLYNQDSRFHGVSLSGVLPALREIEKNIGITFSDAINLDGGTASVFFDGAVTLPELSFVGGFLCAR
ncbi:MAG TPA: hypothetical protein VF985_05910 [Mariniflexile sp.]